ncbi:MAG: CPBP family intramembrane metalloprotease [Candidatus Omnitrophica bacterium]|nr:CPBP family intramembrane metalloprotease [Candidatus Omnitrophota bacterium]
MGKLSAFLYRNKLYIALALFILLINLASTAEKRLQKERAGKTEQLAAEKDEEAAPAEEKKAKKGELFDEEDISARQEKIQKLSETDPVFYIFIGLVNLAILFVILVGFILDGYFLVRLFRREPLRIRLQEQDKPRWTPGDVVRVALIFLASGYAIIIVQAFLSHIFPILRNENFRMVFNTAMMNLIGISVIVYFVVDKYGQDISQIGLTAKGFRKAVFYAAVGYICLVPVLFLIMLGTYFVTQLIEYRPPVQPIVEVFMEEKETVVLWLSTVFAAVFGPIAEEIFFRGFMYGALKKSLGVFWGMMLTAAVFAMLHAHAVGFLPIMMLGLLLAYLYEKTGSLVSSMTVHIMHNLAMVVLVFMMRGIGT